MIYQVSILIDNTPLFINKVTPWVFIQNWVWQRAHLKVTKDIVDIKASKKENFWEFSTLEMNYIKDLFALTVNDISISVD